MAPLLAEVGAVIVGAVAPKTTLDALKPRPDSTAAPVVTVKVIVVLVLA